MSDMSFTWRGQSTDDYGIIVAALPPVIVPGRRTTTEIIPGRSGALHTQDGAWDEQLLTIDCFLPGAQAGVSEIAAIAAWLQGDGQLALSDQTGVYYAARITDAISMTPWVQGYPDRQFAVPFWVDPFRYLSNNPTVTPTNGGTVTNPGTIASEPTITITGTGTVTLTVGADTFEITLGDTATTIVIHSPDMMCCDPDETVNMSGRLSNDDGRWPSFPAGDSVISWTGGVTALSFTGNWRYI